MKGYKAFLSDMTTKHGDNTVYEVGKTYTVEGEVKICENGYHFCKKCVDVYDYYSKPCRICEVSVTGAVQTQGNKSVGRKLKILRELTADEISSLCNSGDCNSGDWNSGDWNSGYCNSGDWNSGDWNSGDWNSGNRNSGNRNSGDCNSGDCNSGNRNSGDCNSGDCNSGNRNSGDWNSGDWNSGNRNSGDWNSGNRNSGNRNSGDCNSGDWNSGDWNSGDWNSGNRNSGNRNSGNRNSGDWNSGDWNSGYCNTTEPTVRLFDHQTDITFSDFKWSRAYGLLCNIPSDCLTWKYSEYMTDDEKAEHPEHETTGGFLYLEKADRQAWWESLSDESKAAITSMPYFDAEKFYMCTNIRVEQQC